MCLLELCAGGDEADEEDVDGFWCLTLGDDVRNRGHDLLDLLFHFWW